MKYLSGLAFIFREEMRPDHCVPNRSFTFHSLHFLFCKKNSQIPLLLFFSMRHKSKASSSFQQSIYLVIDQLYSQHGLSCLLVFCLMFQ